jgi:hypothetical protein
MRVWQLPFLLLDMDEGACSEMSSLRYLSQNAIEMDSFVKAS